MVLPTVSANGSRRLSSPRRINIRNRIHNNKSSSKLNISGLSLLVFVVILLWASIVFVSPRLIHHQTNNNYLNDKLQGPPLKSQHHTTKKKKKRGLLNKLLHHAPIKGRGRLGSSNQYSPRIPPRVVGMYAYPISNESKLFTEDNKKNRNDMRNYLPHYKYITERISPYLLSQTSETLRRIRQHDYFAKNTPLQDFVYNYKMAISGNSEGTYQIKSEDPLKHLMIDSDSRDMLRSIEEDSEDYEGSMAEPLNNENCEATPQQESWMVHAKLKSTCY